MTMKKISLVLIVFAFTLGCRKDKYIPNTCYKENVQPILIGKCAGSGCHNPTDKAAGYDFTNYNGVMEAVTPFKSKKSELYRAISGRKPEMPLNGTKLTEKELDIIKYWIDFGAKKDSCGNSSCDTLSYITYNTHVKPILSLCTGCHPSGSPTGHSLDSYNGVKTSINTGKLLPSIKHTGPKPMPQGGGKLSDCDIAKIQKWFNNGMPEN